jgi:hypothetical protein
MSFGDEVAQHGLSEDGWEAVDQRPSRRKAVDERGWNYQIG